MANNKKKECGKKPTPGTNTRQKSNRNPSGRRGYVNKDAKYDEQANTGRTDASNDVEWYGKDNQLIKDAANLSFFQTAGLPYELQVPQGVTLSNNKKRNPGIMSFKVMPTPGSCGEWSSVANVAIRDIYSFIRHANSGHSNYDAADLGMYMLAYDSCLAYYAWMVRGYGLARTILLKNRYTPEALMAACGINYSSIVSNLAQFRAYINTFAARLSALKVPSSWHIMERHMWMFSHVYADAPVDKAQFYVFAPAGFWEYRTGTTPETTGLYPITGFGNADFGVITSNGDKLLNSILNNEDFNIMSGDIIKAFGDNVFRLNLIAEDYSVLPVYDPEVLLQIHNATVLHGIDVSTWKISQDYSESENVGAILFKAELKIAEPTVRASLVSKILDVPVEAPTPTMVAVATRLMFQTDLIGNETSVGILHCGTEIIVDAEIFSLSNVGIVSRKEWPFSGNYEVFAGRPYWYDVRKSSTGNWAFELDDVHGDFDNYTVVPHDTLANIHRAALMGLYGMVK